jgi:hypothetical protein
MNGYLVAQPGDTVIIEADEFFGLEGKVVSEWGDGTGVTGRMCSVRARGTTIDVHADYLRVLVRSPPVGPLRPSPMQGETRP